MDPGKLNKRIIIQRRFIEQDENGFEIEGWEDYKTVWANTNNINGREYFIAQQAQSKASKKVMIRYIKEIDKTNSSLDYRILYKDDIYNILYCNNIKEENRFMELLLESI